MVWFSTDKMRFLLAYGMLLLSGSCTRIGVQYTETMVGQRITMALYQTSISYVTVQDVKGERLCLFEDDRVYVTLKDKHEGYKHGNDYYFIIKEAKTEDTMSYYWYNFSGSLLDQHVLYIYVLDNSDLHNKVFGIGQYSRFAYQTEMADSTRIQWSILKNSKEATDIYYASKDAGGVLPNNVGIFKESTGGFGVSVSYMRFNEAGRYQCLVTSKSDTEQRVFDVALTINFRCQPANYLINGKEHFHSCSATVSDGDIAPEFTWYRNGQIVNGNLTQVEGSDTVVYTYTYTFTATSDAERANFTCLKTFKYIGPESDVRDTSDPEYRDTCNITYTSLEYPPYNAGISPGSDNGQLILRIGQEFTCSASGTFLSYEWLCDGDPYTGRFLKITESFFTKGYSSCQCRAYNLLSDGITYSTTKSVEFSIVHQSNIIDPPPPAIISNIGEQVKLDCTLAPFVNSSLTIDDFDYQWIANFPDDEDFVKNVIYTAYNGEYGVSNKWSEKFEAGDFKHDLIMKSAQFELEGLYRCEAINYPNVYAFSVDVSFSDSVKCTTPVKKTKRGETVEITCEVEHSGSIEPEMIWYADETAVSVQGAAKTTRKEFSKITEVTMEAEPGVSYKCGVTFRSGLTTSTDECEAFVEIDEEVGDKQVKKDDEDKRDNAIIKRL